MPLTPIDYSKTIIYKIQHKEKPELFYIGHTTNFDSRKYQHSKAHKGILYIMIRAHGGWESFEMLPVKQVDCKNRIDALIAEQRMIDELKATMNYSNPHTKTAQFRSSTQERFIKHLPDIMPVGSSGMIL